MGVPAITFDHSTVKKNKEAFWKDLVSFDKRDYTIFSSSNHGKDTTDVDGVV